MNSGAKSDWVPDLSAIVQLLFSLYINGISTDFDFEVRFFAGEEITECNMSQLMRLRKRPRGQAVSAPDFGSRVRILLEARFFPNLNGASLHRAFHVHPSIVSK